jgi:glycosyltransferase involved in cell wall biosynthesis
MRRCSGQSFGMNSALISCIIPVFNGAKYLGEALDSILKQTYRPLEIIVVDDGSTDTTAGVAACYGDRIRYVRQDNAGAPTARNLGLSLARGEFVAFLDADDLWRPEKLQRQMRRFESRPELDLSVTYLQNFWVADLKNEETRFKDHRLSEPVPGYVTQTLLARGSAFDCVGLFNKSLKVGDPTDWFLRAAEQGLATDMLSDVLVDRRMHESNMSMQAGTRRMTSRMEDSMLRVIKASLDRRRLAHKH